MKQLGIRLSLFFLFSCVSEKEKLAVNIIPQPNNIEIENGSYKLQKKATIGFSNKTLESTALLFITELKGQILLEISDYKNADIKLNLSGSKDESETYSLITSGKGIRINAESETGIFYGLQSLKQLLFFAENTNETIQLPLLEINDSCFPAARYFVRFC